jgi:two-component system, cell cycle response regulator DivK
MTPNPALEPTNAIVCAAAEVRSARSGGYGLKLADDELPDLVLLGVQMPGMDGYEVCRLPWRGPRTRKVPVLMLTVSDDPALNQRA